MGKSRKLQLKAMNKALANFAKNNTKENELSAADTNTIMQNVLYDAPYNNIEVYKSNKLYTTVIDISNKITQSVQDIKPKEE